jgi:uncharacterized membrane protein YfcA
MSDNTSQKCFHQMTLDLQQIGVALAMFIAAFTQAVTGFGSALVGMPLLSQITGVKIGAALMAVVSLPLNVSLLWIQRRGFRWGDVGHLVIASIIGIPLGLGGIGLLNERVVLVGLGILLIGYALYAWLTPRLPELKHPAWSYAFGFASGLLAGGYNVGGPPAVIYGACKRWEPNEFRTNLQALFLIENIFVLAGHVYQRDFTPNVLNLLWFAVPALVVGIILGVVLDRFIPDALFRKMALVLLIVLGARLLLG